MSTLSCADGAALHRLTVEAEADPNALLRLLEPFVIHAVLPLSLTSRVDDAGLSAEIEFQAGPEVAARLAARLGVMVPVRRVALAAVPARAVAA
jgi:hypothetical protein